MNQSSIKLSPLHSTLYAGFLNFGLTWLMPITYLIYLTYQMKFELKRRSVRANSISAHQMDSGMVRENKTTRTLVIIIITFIAFHAFRIFWIFSEIYILLNSNKDDDVPAWYYVTASFCELFVVFNSAFNVIIYLHSNLKETPKIRATRNSRRLHRLRTKDSTDTTATMNLIEPNNSPSRHAENIEEINIPVATDVLKRIRTRAARNSRRLQQLRKKESTDTTATMNLIEPNSSPSRHAKNIEEINTSIATHEYESHGAMEAVKSRRATMQRGIAEIKRKGLAPRRRLTSVS